MKSAPLHRTKIIVAVLIVILVILLTVFFFLSSREKASRQNSPSSNLVVTIFPQKDGSDNQWPDTSIPQPVINVAPTTVYQGTNDKGPWKTTLFADPGSKDWQTNKPSDVRFSYDPTNNTVDVSWTDPMPINTAYQWVIGYFHQPFDPVEKFKEENIPTIFWNAIEAYPTEVNTNETQMKTIPLEELPDAARNIYFYFYKRLPEKNGSYRDYLYGADGTASKPFYQSIR